MSRQRPFIAMFMNLPENDREVSGRREAFLQGVGPIPGLTVATCHGAGDFTDYGTKAQALADTKVDGAGPDVYFCTCWPSLRAVVPVVAGGKPIVFAGTADLRANPMVNPDYRTNVYGFISYGKNLCREWVHLLRAVAPSVTRVAVLYDDSPLRTGPKDVYDEIAAQAALLSPALSVTKYNCASPTLGTELQNFADVDSKGGLIVGVSVLAAKNRQTIIDAARRLKLPAVYPNRLYTLNGGLASKGTYIQGLYRSAGECVRKLLKGQQPPAAPRIDLTQTGLHPDPNKKAVFETVINTKAAADIGLTVDPAVLMKADVIIN